MALFNIGIGPRQPSIEDVRGRLMDILPTLGAQVTEGPVQPGQLPPTIGPGFLPENLASTLAGLIADPITRQVGLGGLQQQLQQQFAQPEAPELTTLQRNLIGAGLQPGTPEYESAMMQAILKPPISLSQSPTPPPNFRFIDVNNPGAGVEPIPGSIADPNSTQFPENRARAKDLRTAYTTSTRVQDALNRYKELIEKHGATILDVKTRTKLGTAYTDLLLEMKELQNLGVLAGPDLELMQTILTDPTGIQGNIMERIGGKDIFNEQIQLVQDKIFQSIQDAEDLFGGPGVDVKRPKPLQELFNRVIPPNIGQSQIPPPPGTIIRQIQ